MQYAKTARLFLLFAGLEHTAPWDDLLDAAMQQVTAELKPGADPEDVRLCFYAAAVANLHFRQMTGREAAPVQTAAGTAVPPTLAERLVRSYRAHCAPLLRDDAFVFHSV